MQYTTEQYTALKAAIAQGALRVRYGDKEVEYRSVEQMEKILSSMEVELGIKKPGLRKKYVSFSKGLK